jgi:hypothetical protein
MKLTTFFSIISHPRVQMMSSAQLSVICLTAYVTCASKTGIMSAALFLRKMKIKKIGRNW